MTSDEDALSWPGDKPDRVGTPGASSSAKKKSALPSSGADGESHGPAQPKVERPTFDELMDPGKPAQLPSWALVVFGLFAGVYLLFSVAWLVIALNPPVAISDPVGSFMWVGSLWLATFGGIIWFLSTLALGASRSVAWRLMMLVIGAIVLVPWPYLSMAVR
jgi:hypothetical protein